MRSVSPTGGSLKRFGRVLDAGFEGVSGRSKEKNHVVSLKTFGNSNYFRIFAPLVPAKPLIDAQMRGAFYFYCIQIWPNDILQNLILLHQNWCNFFAPEGWKSAMSRKPSTI